MAKQAGLKWGWEDYLDSKVKDGLELSHFPSCMFSTEMFNN